MIKELALGYLERIDQTLPGYVRGLYVVGSAALGAWQAGSSDVDMVILTSRPANGDDLTRLAQLHAEMPHPPHVDGVYLEPALVNIWPSDNLIVPFVVNGEFKTDAPCGDLNPVLWLTLQRYGIRLRGPAVADLNVRVDPDQLRRYNLDNLRGYWQALAGRLPSALADVPADEIMDSETVTRFVLGPARLHYTLSFGDIISKAAAGVYLAQLFPEYADLVQRAIRWRAGDGERFTAADLITAGASANAVADDAWRRFAG